ncbi:MAG: sigma-70 family RNA polymerase sigma factor [bacterium]|nr:sigma-70 family RNA polymerase sigma factor [bacterium]
MVTGDTDRKDAVLAKLAQRGDRDAYGELVTRFQNRMYSFCYQFFRNPDIASDLAQETFLRAYRYIKKYDPDKKFSTWLYSIAKNICIDEHRKMGRGKTVSIDDLPPEKIRSTEDSLHLKNPMQISMQIQDRMMLEEAIGRLPEKYRTVIILCYFQEMPYQEIADVLGLNLNLVKVRIFRAKKRLLEILNEESGAGIPEGNEDD